MNRLLPSDKHCWQPVPQVVDWLCDSLAAQGAVSADEVLEIGPGHAPFPRAGVFVDFVERSVPHGTKLIKLDAGSDKLPFGDKSFAFVYCRHVIEDMHNPFPLIAEMERVGLSGYIETPSPIAELCRGVDGGAPYYRGYHHHRYIAWTHMGELRMVSKYPLIEYFGAVFDECAQHLRAGPKYWNTYHQWTDTIRWTHRQNALDFDMMRDYAMLLADAVKQSLVSTDEFWQSVPDKIEISNLAQAFA